MNANEYPLGGMVAANGRPSGPQVTSNQQAAAYGLLRYYDQDHLKRLSPLGTQSSIGLDHIKPDFGAKHEFANATPTTSMVSPTQMPMSTTPTTQMSGVVSGHMPDTPPALAQLGMGFTQPYRD